MRSQHEDVDAIHLMMQMPEDMHHITALRHTTRCLTESLGFVRQDVEDIELILAELATNAVRHAHGGGYEVMMHITNDQTTITVADHGPGFSAPPSTPQMPRFEELPDGITARIGGFGLPLVIALSDQVDIEPTVPHGTTIRACKVISRR